MVDQQEPFAFDPMPSGKPAPPGIPMARPASLPDATRTASPAHDIMLLGSTGKEAWADIGAAIVIIAALDLVTGYALMILSGTSDLREYVPLKELERVLLLPTVAVRCAGTIGVIALILRNRRQSARSIGVSSCGWGLNIAIGVGSTGAAYALIIVWQMALWFVWPELGERMNANAERLMELIPRLHPLGFVPFTFMVGLYEELIFRGFLMTRLRRGTGSWVVAVALSTLIFTALHAFDQETVALIPIAILSIVFSLVTIWRRSIVPAIVGHFLFDLCSLVFLYLLAGDSWS